MTVDEIKDKIAVDEFGYSSWAALCGHYSHMGRLVPNEVLNKVISAYAKQEAEQAFNAGMKRGKDDVKEYFISDYEGQSPDKETYLLKYK